jgi:cytoskeleton protein RodZ
MSAPVGVGGRLREARERRGFSISQVASSTKIPASTLDALERGDVARLPAGVFTRGFVRAYAGAVGLDPETTLQQFLDEFPNASLGSHTATVPLEDNEQIESDRLVASGAVRLLALSLPIVAVVVYLGAVGRRVPQAETGVPGAVGTAHTQGAAAQSSQTPPIEAPPEPAPAILEGLTLSLAATAPCWISAAVDGAMPVQRLLQAGDEQRFDARSDIVLRVGNAAALRMAINGKAARPLGRSGQVVTVRLNTTNAGDYLAR